MKEVKKIDIFILFIYKSIFHLRGQTGAARKSTRDRKDRPYTVLSTHRIRIPHIVAN